MALEVFYKILSLVLYELYLYYTTCTFVVKKAVNIYSTKPKASILCITKHIHKFSGSFEKEKKGTVPPGHSLHLFHFPRDFV